MAPLAPGLWRGFSVYQIFGANTDVGKTIFSTVICKSLKDGLQQRVRYLKPVSTGPQDDADIKHILRFAGDVASETLFQFEEPVSPHIAAKQTTNFVPDDKYLVEAISRRIRQQAQGDNGVMLVETAGGVNSPGPSGTLQADLYRPLRLPTILIADSKLGGISTSVSAYESLHMRGYDVAGVALFKEHYYKNYEYLHDFFAGRNIPCLAIDPPPERAVNQSDDHRALELYYNGLCPDKYIKSDETPLARFLWGLLSRNKQRIDKLESMAPRAFKQIWWPFTQHQSITADSITTIDSAYGDYFHTYRPPSRSAAQSDDDVGSGALQDLRMPAQTSNVSPYSSTPDHTPKPTETRDTSGQQPNTIMVEEDHQKPNLLQSTLDASASWWTQGLGHGNPELTMAASYAAGRYGHVMFAEAIHEPALTLASRLLNLCRNPRLKRVFFSDNGSTGMEVASKMALKAACVRYGWNMTEQDVEIIGLQGSYHGDTMGCMDMSEPSVYNEKIPWYKGRGFWFECPSVRMESGRWVITDPSVLKQRNIPNTEYASLQQVFDFGRDNTERAEAYEEHIKQTLEKLTRQDKRRFGALVMEPVVLGAGGMLLADPLFQRVLTHVVRDSEHLFSSQEGNKNPNTDGVTWTGLPVVADEVFTGLFRLGHRTSCSLLNIHPDISVHAKLLTGGLVPLCTTLASENIFEAFLADNKTEALLHGHSYTAHPVGCAVANASLEILINLDNSNFWTCAQDDWRGAHNAVSSMSKETGSEKDMPPRAQTPGIWSNWSYAFITKLSNATERIEGVWALGSVLAITFRDAEGTGYTSTAAKQYQKLLLHGQGEGWNVHSRVLGNVLYLMASQTTKDPEMRSIEEVVIKALNINADS